MNQGPIFTPVLVEVVEGGAEFVELLLADALGVPCQDLVLHLVDGAVDGGEKLFPAHTQGFHGVLGVPGEGRKGQRKKKCVTSYL